MLSPALSRKNHIISVCVTGGDILPGTVFEAAEIAFPDDRMQIPFSEAIVCIGKRSDSEMLFSAANGRYFFTVADGWGAEDRVLYGLKIGVCFDFNHPTTVDSAIAQLEQNVKPTYTTWGGAMAYAAKTGAQKRILAALKRQYKE